MSDAAWDAYASAAASRVAAALREVLANAGADAAVAENRDGDYTCDFTVAPAAKGAARFRVILRTVEGEIHAGRSVYRFEWLDIATASELVADVFAAIVAGRLTEWGPTWHLRTRIELPDGAELDFGRGAVLGPWRARQVRRYSPYV